MGEQQAFDALGAIKRCIGLSNCRDTSQNILALNVLNTIHVVNIMDSDVRVKSPIYTAALLLDNIAINVLWEAYPFTFNPLPLFMYNQDETILYIVNAKQRSMFYPIMYLPPNGMLNVWDKDYTLNTSYGELLYVSQWDKINDR